MDSEKKRDLEGGAEQGDAKRTKVDENGGMHLKNILLYQFYFPQ
tara:strand:- start:391 stop:522 length:132 start_codon:yes stop_codon:yes gene_type:complete